MGVPVVYRIEFVLSPHCELFMSDCWHGAGSAGDDQAAPRTPAPEEMLSHGGVSRFVLCSSPPPAPLSFSLSLSSSQLSLRFLGLFYFQCWRRPFGLRSVRPHWFRWNEE